MRMCIHAFPLLSGASLRCNSAAQSACECRAPSPIQASFPQPVLGGAAMVMFVAVAASGINILASTRLDRRALLIIAVSLALGLGVAQVPEFLAHMPAAIRNVLESGVATGGICALVLNWFLPESKEQA